jgi:hypothetical protein
MDWILLNLAATGAQTLTLSRPSLSRLLYRLRYPGSQCQFSCSLF